MPARKARRRPLPLPEVDQWRKTRRLTVMCAQCGVQGSWDPARGIVSHPLRPTCRVQIIRDEEAQEAA